MLQESEVRRTFSKVDKQRRGCIDNADDFELLVLALGHNATAKVISLKRYLTIHSVKTYPLMFVVRCATS